MPLDLGQALGYAKPTEPTTTPTIGQGRDLGAALGYGSPIAQEAPEQISGAQAFGRGVQAQVAELNPINAAIGIFSDTWKEKTQAYQATLNKEYEAGKAQHPISALAGTAAGGVLAGSPMAAAAAPTSLTGLATQGAIQGGLSSAISQENTQGQVYPTQIAGSALAGAAIGGVVKGISSAFGQPTKAGAQVAAEAAENKIPLDTRNLIDGGILNRLPFATPNAIGVQQQEALTPAIQRLIEKVSGSPVKLTEESVGDAISSQANQISKQQMVYMII
jgi:hypothetical protein